MGPRGPRAYGLRPRLWLLIEFRYYSLGEMQENVCKPNLQNDVLILFLALSSTRN